MSALLSPPRSGADTAGQSCQAYDPPRQHWLPQRPWLRPIKSVETALTLIVFLALAVRLLLLTTQSGWQDEGYTLAAVHRPFAAVLAQATQFDVHPPLYYALLHVWMRLVGYGLVQGRLLSVICGVGAVPVTYAIGRMLFGRTTGLCAALLLAVSPIATWYADEMRMYALVGLAMLVTLAFLVHGLQYSPAPHGATGPHAHVAQESRRSRAREWWPWLAYAFAAVCAFYIDYSAIYMLVGAAVGSLLWVARDVPLRGRWLVAHALAALLALPLLPDFLYQTAQNLAQTAWIPAPTTQSVETTLLDLLSQYTGPRPLLEALGLILCALVLIAAVLDWRAHTSRRTYLFMAVVASAPVAIPLLIGAAGVVSHPIFLTRTAMGALYGLLVLAARGLVRPWSTRLYVRPALIALVALLAINVSSLRAAYATTINEDWRGAAAYLRGQSLPGDVLIFDPSYVQLPFDLYWQHPAIPTVRRGYDHDEGLLTARPRALRTERDMVAAIATAPNVWLITREFEPTSASLPDDLVGRWLPRHLSPAGYYHVHGVTVRRFTRLKVINDATTWAWLEATDTVLRGVQPADLVVAYGQGTTTFLRAWSTYPHAHAPLLTLHDGESAAQLDRAVQSHTGTVWLVRQISGTGDPAGIASNWLYRHGPQRGSPRFYGPIRIYTFASGWSR